jgi:hypothetical protein
VSLLNQADCLERLRDIIFNAGRKKKEPTEEDLARIEIK